MILSAKKRYFDGMVANQASPRRRNHLYTGRTYCIFLNFNWAYQTRYLWREQGILFACTIPPRKSLFCNLFLLSGFWFIPTFHLLLRFKNLEIMDKLQLENLYIFLRSTPFSLKECILGWGPQNAPSYPSIGLKMQCVIHWIPCTYFTTNFLSRRCHSTKT